MVSGFFVLAWGHARAVLEGCTEIALAGKACHFGDFRYGKVGVLYEALCFFDTEPGDIFLHSGSCYCLHLVEEGGTAHSEFPA